MFSSRAARMVGLLLILLCTAGCDQVTKHLARTRIGQSGSIRFPGGLAEFTLAENPGAFLSLGEDLPLVGRKALCLIIALGVSCLMGYLVASSKLTPGAFLSLSLLCAGGMSNLIDRFLRDGRVTDFMVLRLGSMHTGVFNLADMVIVLGSILLVVTWWRQRGTQTGRGDSPSTGPA